MGINMGIIWVGGTEENWTFPSLSIFPVDPNCNVFKAGKCILDQN